MSRKTIRSLLLAVLASSVLVLGQGRLPVRGTFDDRLEAIEGRLDALEDRMAIAEERISSQPRPDPDRLSLESEAKLDRLEVRLIHLESNPTDCDCGGESARALLGRIRAVERQVSRLRFSPSR